MSSSKNLEYEKTSFLNKSNSAFIERMYLKFINKEADLPESLKKTVFPIQKFKRHDVIRGATLANLLDPHVTTRDQVPGAALDFHRPTRDVSGVGIAD